MEGLEIEQSELSEINIKVFDYGIDMEQEGSIISFDYDTLPILIEHLIELDKHFKRSM